MKRINGKVDEFATGRREVISSAGNITLTKSQVLGQFVVISSAGTVTLPAVEGALGWSVTVYSTVAGAVHVDPDDDDRFILDGVALANGDKATSASAIGDVLDLINNDGDGWVAISGKTNDWTDGN